jgi:hypothetical protein
MGAETDSFGQWGTLCHEGFEVRYVSANGGIRWNSRWVNVSIVCVGEYVGLEAIADGLWNVYSAPLRLGPSVTCGSRMSTGGSTADTCNPCPRTLLLPISPTAQYLDGR